MLKNLVFILLWKSITVDCAYNFDPRNVGYCDKRCWNGFSSSGCDCLRRGGREEITSWIAWFRKTMLKLHNDYRNKVARGDLVNVNFPKSARMNALNYDLELEYLARCFGVGWLETKHDVCKMTTFCRRGQDPTQLIYGQLDKMPDKYEELERVVKYWFDTFTQIPVQYRKDVICKFRSTGKGDMFTQLVWGAHTRVGCARVWNPNNPNPRYRFAVICNYAGSDDVCPGNIESEPVYDIGEPCRECRSLKCNNQTRFGRYDALCGSVDYSIPSTLPIIEVEKVGMRALQDRARAKNATKEEKEDTSGKGTTRLDKFLFAVIIYTVIY